MAHSWLTRAPHTTTPHARTQTKFAGFWLKDEACSTPYPLPLDTLMELGWFLQRAHETIPGIRVSFIHPTSSACVCAATSLVAARGRRDLTLPIPSSNSQNDLLLTAPQFKETNATLSLTAKPRSVPLGPLSRYHESFAKDGSVTYMTLRRDQRIGRSSGQMFFTACGTLILRVHGRGFFCDEPDMVCEDYITLSDDGRTIFTRQKCYLFATKRAAEQVLVGRRTGDEPSPGLV